MTDPQFLGAGLIIAAPASGSGKTLFTLGCLRYLRNAGVRIASGKIGPDYIDPAFHSIASGSPCVNIDPWAMRPATFQHITKKLAASADQIIVEGVMGLFDGVGLKKEPSYGSSATVASELGWPIILIIDAAGQAASAAIVLKAFAQESPSVRIKGVVFNCVGSAKHATILTEAALKYVPQVKVLGCLPRDESLILPERHLGLVQATEHPSLNNFLDHAAKWVGDNIDVRNMIDLSEPIQKKFDDSQYVPLNPLGQKIAIAYDAAFSFVYNALLESWKNLGVEISFFSPLEDQCPSDLIDAIYLPGGYPELHAGKLSNNFKFKESLKKAASRGVIIYGECGGYMVLGQQLVDKNGACHKMTGLLELKTSFKEPKLHLGYRELSLVTKSALGDVNKKFRGHEFHFASTVKYGPGTPLFSAKDAHGFDLGKVGLVNSNVCGSFIHLVDNVN